jgi:hypothetical protein
VQQFDRDLEKVENSNLQAVNKNFVNGLPDTEEKESIQSSRSVEMSDIKWNQAVSKKEDSDRISKGYEEGKRIWLKDDEEEERRGKGSSCSMWQKKRGKVKWGGKEKWRAIWIVVFSHSVWQHGSSTECS